MVAKGEIAPDFEAPTSQGNAVRLSALRGRPVVLYFFPKADTPGCTIESKAFRDLQPEFTRRGVQVVGISTDDVPDQVHFAEKCDLPFPLVADPTKSITRSFGVLGVTGRARRVTFYLDANGQVLDTVDSSLPGSHVDRARALFLPAK